MLSLLLTTLLTNPTQLNTPAPDFAKATAWLNSKPLTLADLKGKVIVVHFFAFNCINCRRNYPWYKQVQDQYKPDEVVILGIHTPELQAEYNIESLKKKLADAGLKHPILVDNEYATWKAYNNRLWPCIYLIDKKGHARFRWDGELEWQNAAGSRIMHDNIRLLMKE